MPDLEVRQVLARLSPMVKALWIEGEEGVRQHRCLAYLLMFAVGPQTYKDDGVPCLFSRAQNALGFDEDHDLCAWNDEQTDVAPILARVDKALAAS